MFSTEYFTLRDCLGFLQIKSYIVLIVGSKNFFDLSDVTYTLVVYITYNMGNRDLPDIYAHALGPAALGLGHIYQANPSCPCYNLYTSLENLLNGCTFVCAAIS